jgi:glycosyltransferase involved in cell wall biosynthesis
VWIGTIAELHKNKGHIHTLKALKLLKEEGFFKNNNVQCVFVGEGEERVSLEKISKNLGLEDQVIFLGKIPDGAQYLKAFDIFLLTSNTEALGYVLIEAGMARVPVIGSLVGGIPEVIEDMKTGILVHRKNPKEIAHAIQYMLEHKDKQKEFSDALYTKVKNLFSIEKMIQETERIYLK